MSRLSCGSRVPDVSISGCVRTNDLIDGLDHLAGRDARSVLIVHVVALRRERCAAPRDDVVSHFSIRLLVRGPCSCEERVGLADELGCDSRRIHTDEPCNVDEASCR